MEALLNHPEARAEIKRRLAEHATIETSKAEVRQLNTGLVGGLVTLLDGTLSAVLDNVLGLIPTNDAVKGLQKFPEGMFASTIYANSVTFAHSNSTIPIRGSEAKRPARPLSWPEYLGQSRL